MMIYGCSSPKNGIFIGIDPYPYMFHGFFFLFPIVATGRSTTAWEARPPCAEKKFERCLEASQGVVVVHGLKLFPSRPWLGAGRSSGHFGNGPLPSTLW